MPETSSRWSGSTGGAICAVPFWKSDSHEFFVPFRYIDNQFLISLFNLLLTCCCIFESIPFAFADFLWKIFWAYLFDRNQLVAFLGSRFLWNHLSMLLEAKKFHVIPIHVISSIISPGSDFAGTSIVMTIHWELCHVKVLLMAIASLISAIWAR